jgi:PAS domain S-box-containing protein
MEHPAICEKILESLNSGIVATGAGGNIKYINSEALRLLDLNPPDATKLDVRQLLPETGNLIHECLLTGTARMGYYLATGSRRLVIDVAPIRINGNIEGVVATLHRLEDFNDALCYSDGYLNLIKQLDAIFKGSSDGLWVHDSKGKIININTVSEMINGIRAKDVIGRSIYDLIEEGVFEGAVTPEILRTKRQFSTLSYNKKTQKRVLVTGTPILDENGKRDAKPFIQINCAALPESLLEAELFGYEKGAFTGAREQGKIGLFELAHEGTLFLDEIGDLPLSVQAKLLKYLDDQEILPLAEFSAKKCTVV